jgi:hypothetical protein
MTVIPLTLAISLCLVFTFVIFFLREYSRQRFSSAESEALLPLAEETPVPARRDRRPAAPRGHQASGCACHSGERTACGGCRAATVGSR